MFKLMATSLVVVAVAAALMFSPRGDPSAPVDPARDRTQVAAALLRMPRVTWVTTSFVTADETKKARYELRLEDEMVVNVLSLPSTQSCPPLAVPAGGDVPAQDPAIPPRAHLSLCEWAQFVEPKKSTTETLNTLVPFINGVALKGAFPHAIEIESRPKLEPRLEGAELTRFHYRLTRSDASREAWRTLLGRPGTSGAHRLVRFTLGTESGFTLDTQFDDVKVDSADATQIQLMVVSAWWPYVVALMLCLLLWFLYEASTGDILRDRPAKNGKRATYSLAKSQMAVWLFLVVGGYLLIWMVTRDRGDIPGTILALIGLSSATTVGALLIEARQREQRRRLAPTSPDLIVRRDEAKRQVDHDATNVDLKNRLAAAEADLKAATDAENAFVESRSFLDDILSDGSGASLHRLQIVIWTGVLALIFVATAWRSLAMPEFSEGLLALMGISSGTYLGFKSTET